MPPKHRLVPFINHDKANQTEVMDPTNIGNLVCPFRMGLAGPPSCGKTSFILNLILNQSPPWQCIRIIHLDPNSQEYKDVDAEIIHDIPTDMNAMIDSFDRDVKTLLIVEDIPLRTLTPKKRSVLDRALGYISSHKSVSVICTMQDPFNILPTLKSLLNILVLWKMPMLSRTKALTRQFNLQDHEVGQIFTGICRGKHDSLMIDHSGSGPRLRKNLFIPIDLDGDSSSDDEE